MLVIAGTNWNESAWTGVDVPPGVTTVIGWSPVPAGASTTMVLSESLTSELTKVVPKFTPEASLKAVPVMVTWVPPVAGPVFGVTLVTAGAAR